MIQCKTDKLGPPVMALNGNIFEIYLLRNHYYWYSCSCQIIYMYANSVLEI